ncbi:hypothetical protein C8F01DRAFT_1106310 [Mycena amicta]|nr:hypothetical protein C8F01DRAFT_1106310 [Mycena amicta]
MVGLFEQTPQEHADDYTALLEEQTATHVWKPIMQVPPGHVKVQFYLHENKVRDNLRPDMQAVLPLESSGELSLYAVRKMWGLDTLAVVTVPRRLRLASSTDPDRFPAEGVKTLVERCGSIKVIERQTSTSTLIIRHLRQILLSLGLISNSYLILARNGAKHDLRKAHEVITVASKKGYNRAYKRASKIILSPPLQKVNSKIDWPVVGLVCFITFLVFSLWLLLGWVFPAPEPQPTQLNPWIRYPSIILLIVGMVLTWKWTDANLDLRQWVLRKLGHEVSLEEVN